MTAEAIVRALGGRHGMCRCPAHEDRSPSLSVRERGKVLVRCHAGCSQTEVIAALRARGLWLERPRRDWTPEQRERWARERREIERVLPAARLWQRAAVLLAEETLHTLKTGLVDPLAPQPGVGEIQHLEAVLRNLRVHDDAGLVAEFTWWQQHHPGLTAALVDIARRRDKAERRALAAFLQQMGESERAVA